MSKNPWKKTWKKTAKNPNSIGILKEFGKNDPKKVDKKTQKSGQKIWKNGKKYEKKSPKKLNKKFAHLHVVTQLRSGRPPEGAHLLLLFGKKNTQKFGKNL